MLGRRRKVNCGKENPTSEHVALPEPEGAIVVPDAPKVPRVHMKRESRKDKGIVIVEGTPEAKKSPSIPTEDKGKNPMQDPSIRPKKQKLNPPVVSM